MDERIRNLLSQITALEEELKEALHQREIPLFYQIKGKKIHFEKAIRDQQRRLKINVVLWIATSRPQNFITAPFIYGLIFPFVLLDLFVTLYQAISFPIYKIRKVKRSDYIVFDRWQLGYLNVIEKFHCVYCEYANGLIAYVTEIAARTEQYWCPIKHARKILGTHAKYRSFLAYGEAQSYQIYLEKLRTEMEIDARKQGDEK